MKAIEDAPTVDAVDVVKDMFQGEMRLIDVDAVQGEEMSNQRVIEWVPVREQKPHLPGMYLITVKAYINNKWDGKTVGTSATNWHNNKWLGRIQDDVLAWAKMPAAWTDEEEQLTLF